MGMERLPVEMERLYVGMGLYVCVGGGGGGKGYL